ncbi:MAG: hypothetical protein RLZZ422_206 [Pseudomonadota bacterium]|jgi:predicted nucleic acid-binding protein
MYLLDTNVVSELRRQKPHGAVVAWLQSVDDKELYLSSVTLAEIQAGIELTRDQNPHRATELEVWLDQVAATYNILSLDGIAFRAWAKLMHKKSDTLYEDAMIAAIAQVNKLIVVTRNITDFEGFDVKLLNPFEYKNHQTP